MSVRVCWEPDFIRTAWRRILELFCVFPLRPRFPVVALLGVLLLSQPLQAAVGGSPCAIQRAASIGSQVWLLCDRGELFISADEGATWQAKRLPSDSLLRSIAVVDAKRAFVVGDTGAVYATEDGAATWGKVAVPTEENLTAVQFVGARGWIAGWTGLILHSEDGGKTWVRQPTGVLHGLESLYFADAEHGWAGGWAGTILRTENGGRTWNEVRMPHSLWSIDAVYFRDARNGWAVGFNGQVLASSDGGRSWRELRVPTQAWLKSVSCDNSGRVWISSEYELLVSDDSGRNWKRIPVEGLIFIRHVLPMRDSVWAVGQFGVLRTSGGEPVLSALTSLPGRAGGGSQLNE